MRKKAKKAKKSSKTQHKKRNPNQTNRNHKTTKSNIKRRRKEREIEKTENYIEQKFKIQKHQQPFYRILELALLNKEKYYKKNETKSSNTHTNKPALHKEPTNNNRALQRL